MADEPFLGNADHIRVTVTFVAGVGQLNLDHFLRMAIHWPATFAGVLLTLTAGIGSDTTPDAINDGEGTSGLAFTVVPGEITSPGDSTKTLQVAGLGWVTLTSDDLSDAGDVEVELTR